MKITRREYRTPEIPIVGNQPSIQLWHGKPHVHGKNPYNWPLYRVIWSESRYYLLEVESGATPARSNIAGRRTTRAEKSGCLRGGSRRKLTAAPKPSGTKTI